MIDSNKKNSGSENEVPDENNDGLYCEVDSEAAGKDEKKRTSAGDNENLTKEGKPVSVSNENGNKTEPETAETEDKNYPFMKKTQIKKIRTVMYVILFIAAILLIIFRDKL